jgi:hypothetical protein
MPKSATKEELDAEYCKMRYAGQKNLEDMNKQILDMTAAGNKETPLNREQRRNLKNSVAS